MDFIVKFFTQAKDVFTKLDKTKRIIIGVVGGVVSVSFAILLTVSGSEPNAVLFSEINTTDFGSVTRKLGEMGFKYSTSGTSTILVKPSQRDVILTRLAQEDEIPAGIPGWKLFDITKWTETEREIDVKYMRALRDEIKKHLESLKNVDKATVDIAIAKDSLFTRGLEPYTAAVSVSLAPGYEKLSRKEIKGIVYLVSRAVGNRLKPEDITVTDDHGNIISNFDDEFDQISAEYKKIENRKKLEEKERIRMLNDIKEGLSAIFTEDRIQVVRLNMDFNWDKISEEQQEVTPVVMVPEDPTVPYSTRVVQDSLIVSEKTTEEHFKGHGWNPQGPAGTDSNVPPGYKASDDQFAQYDKIENIRNHEFNKTSRTIERQPFEVSRVSVAIVIDGIQDLPRNEDGSYDFDPMRPLHQVLLTEEELAKAEDVVKTAINFDTVRKDQVSVQNILFDRTSQFNILREEYRRQEQLRKLFIAALIGVVSLFVGFVLFRTIQREIERRRRIREERLALEQQRMREAALRSAEEKGVEVELSLEERARMELQQNAINLARERPEDVALLLRTWLAEE